MTFAEIIEKLRDGKRYKFGHPNIRGFFHKAPWPSQDQDAEIDGSLSAITCWNTAGTKMQAPVFLLSDFDEDKWWIKEVTIRKPVILQD